MIEAAFVVCVVILVFAAYKTGESNGMVKGGRIVSESTERYRDAYHDGKKACEGWEEEARDLKKKLERLNAKMLRELKAGKEKRK